MRHLRFSPHFAFCLFRLLREWSFPSFFCCPCAATIPFCLSLSTSSPLAAWAPLLPLRPNRAEAGGMIWGPALGGCRSLTRLAARSAPGSSPLLLRPSEWVLIGRSLWFERLEEDGCLVILVEPASWPSGDGADTESLDTSDRFQDMLWDTTVEGALLVWVVDVDDVGRMAGELVVCLPLNDRPHCCGNSCDGSWLWFRRDTDGQVLENCCADVDCVTVECPA